MRKMNSKRVIVENIDISNDVIKYEVNSLFSYFAKNIDINAYRFTFMTRAIDSIEEVTKLEDDSFLSSSILINYESPDDGWQSYLYQSIVTLPRVPLPDSPKCGSNNYLPLLNNYYHVKKTFSCNVDVGDGKSFEFKILGTFFCQQNGRTSVCAHACLCMTINNIPNIEIITTEDINKILSIDHVKVKIKHNQGLSEEDIKMVLEKHGLSYNHKDFFEEPNVMYDDYIYRYIESKCPVLLVFTTDDYLNAHVVSVIGHTLNTDIWKPEAEQAYTSRATIIDSNKSASKWIDHFIIHDDNFGMYSCLPVDTLKRVTLPRQDPRFRASFAISVIPAGVHTPGWEAEWASLYILRAFLKDLIKNNVRLDDWTGRIVMSMLTNPPQPIVARTFLSKKEEYESTLYEKDFDGNSFTDEDRQNLTRNLPDLFWITEVTLPDLYTTNKHKIVDLFYVSDEPMATSVNDFNCRWKQIRFPGALYANIPGFKPVPLNVVGHYPLFRYDYKGEKMEW